MRDDWARIIELERRQRKNSYELNALERTIKAAKEKLKLADQALPPTILSPGGGGGGGAGFRWETRYRIRCIFNTAPTFSSAGSDNAALDGASFDAAVDFLSQWHEFEYWTYPEFPDPAFRIAYHYHGLAYSVYHNVGDTIDDSDCQRWEVFGISAFKKIDATHLTYYRAVGSFSYFPDSYKIVVGADETEYTGSNKYVPDVTRDRFGTSPYWDTANDDNWYDRYPEVTMKDWSSSYAVTNKEVTYNAYDEYDEFDRTRTLRFARKVIDDMTEQPFDPFVFSYGPEAGTTGSYTFPATLIESGPISSEGDVEIEIEWGPA